MKKILLVLCIATLLIGCNRQQQKSENAFFKGKDSYQREVVLEKEPLRVVSFSQAVTEAIFLLHAEDKLVGISQFCDYPPETQKIPKVGDLININVENVLKQNPLARALCVPHSQVTGIFPRTPRTRRRATRFFGSPATGLKILSESPVPI